MENEITWQDKKIRGSIAEACARSHFEALGYSVENVGIEYFLSSEAYKCLTNEQRNLHISKELQQLIQRMPDFLIYRRQPYNVLLVEAKYRTTLHLVNTSKAVCECGHRKSLHLYTTREQKCLDTKEETTCLGCYYTDIMNIGKDAISPGNVLFYVVGRNVTLNDESLKSCILINLAFQGRWLTSNEKKQKITPIYKGSDPKTDFFSVARDVIEPALAKIHGTNPKRR